MNYLEKMFEHNNWANQRILQACLYLDKEQLDARPQTATRGSIRETLMHLVKSQAAYLRTLTLPLESRLTPIQLEFADLERSLQESGQGLLALVRDPRRIPTNPISTSDGYSNAPWVLLVQIIDHAAEHREQIKSMLTSLGLNPPDIDGWSYGESVKAVLPPSP